MSSILPSFLDTGLIEEAQATLGVQEIPREYGIDFDTGQLTGAIVEGIEAVKVWIWNCLHTERFRYGIYTWQYGAEYEQYIGEVVTDEYLQSDCQTETEDALMVNPYITGLSDFKAELDDAKLHVSFTVETTLGGNTEVNMYV